MLTNAGNAGSTLTGEDASVAFRARSDSSRTPSFAHAHHAVDGCCGRKPTGLSCNATWGGAFALAFRRGVFASLDVSCTATATLPPCRRCQAKGALLDKLLRVTGLALLLQTNLSVKPCAKFYATDPSLRLRGIHHRSGMALLVRLAAPLA